LATVSEITFMTSNYDQSSFLASAKLRRNQIYFTAHMSRIHVMKEIRIARRKSFIAWMESRRLKRRDIERDSGVPYTTLASYISGQTDRMQPETEQAIADAYRVHVDDIFKFDAKSDAQKRDLDPAPYANRNAVISTLGSPKRLLHSSQITHIVPVLGKVEAGAWREMIEEHITADTEYLECEFPEYEGKQIRSHYVEGRSIEKFVPHGGKVLYVSPNDVIGGLQQNDYVVVSRPNGAGQFEITVKRLAVTEQGDYELWPESDDPRWQEPYTIPARNVYAQEGMAIIGVVIDTRLPRLQRSGIPVPRIKTAS